MDLTVEIEGDIGRLEEALRKFTSTEILDGDNKYLCSRLVSSTVTRRFFKNLLAQSFVL